MRRKRLVLADVVALFGIVAAAAYAAHPSTSAARANKGADRVVGAWHVTVNVDGSPTPFDTLYLFTGSGGFVRIDGRNDVPGLGDWRESTENRVALTVVLFSFDASGQRVGTIRSNMLAWARNG